MALFTLRTGEDFGRLVSMKSSQSSFSLLMSGKERQSSSSSGYSISSQLFSFLSVSILSQMTSCRGVPRVSCRQKMKHQAPTPKKAVRNQLFIPIASEISVTNGETVLPICPTTLVHPNPRLLISVGYSSATYTQQMDQKPQRMNRLIIKMMVSTHFKADQLSAVCIVMRNPSTKERTAEIPIPNKVALFRLHLSMMNQTMRYPAIQLTPKMT